MVYNNNSVAKKVNRGVPLLHRYILKERRIDEGYLHDLQMGRN